MPAFCRCRSCLSSRIDVFRWWRDVCSCCRSHANDQIAVSDGSTFPRPLVRGTLLSGRFKTRTSRWWFELASLWVHPPVVVLQINTYIWRWFGSLRAGATVLYGINRRNGHLCRLAASLLHEPFEYGEFLIAHFTLFNCVDKIADLLSRQPTNQRRIPPEWVGANEDHETNCPRHARLDQNHSFSSRSLASLVLRRSFICWRRWGSTVSVIFASTRLRFLSWSDLTSTANISSSEYPFFITSVRNVILTFPGGACRPSWCRFHSCTRRPQRRLWCLVRRVAPAPGPVTSAALAAVTPRLRRHF